MTPTNTPTDATGTSAADLLDDRFTDHQVELNGISLHYVSGGTGDLVLFVHGFPTFFYMWRHQLTHLVPSYQVVAPDMRGYNLSSSPAPAPYYNVGVLVEDLRQLLDHLGHRRCTIVGDDWGGLLTWAFALTHPDRVSRAIILSSPHPAIFDRELKNNPTHQDASNYLLGLREPGSEAIIAADDYALFRQLILDLDAIPPDAKATYLHAWRTQGGLRGGLNWYRAAWLGPPAPNGEPAHGNYCPHIVDQQIQVPVMVIKATGCPYFLDSTLDGLEHWVPQLTTTRVKTTSHWITEERPDEVNQLIANYLEDRTPT